MKLLVSDYDGTFDTSVNDIELNCKNHGIINLTIPVQTF